MPAFIDIVKGQAVSLANQGLQKSLGNLRGVIGSKLNRAEPTENPNLRPRLDPKSFTFPLDVTNPDQGLGNHGHYMLFFINEQQNADISFGRKQADAQGAASVLKARAENGISEFVKNATDTISASGFGQEFETVKNKLGLDSLIDGLSQSVGESTVNPKELQGGNGKSVIEQSKNTAIVKRKATTRLDTAIALYMPPTINVSYTANYTDTEIGALAATVSDALAAPDAGSAIKKLMSDDTKDEMVDAATKALLAVAGGIPGAQGARELFEMNQGFIMTNRMELAFKGLPKRGFQYTFKMIPKSELEAEEIKNIVDAFKINMLPEGMDADDKSGFTGKRLEIPNTFDIKYMYVGKENEYLHKISTCVLESMNISYGGDRFKAFDGNSKGAPPVETTMTLNFKEMELITRQRAREGF
tara:strand:+ start:2388 stop:3635 length:1248 start_codon:yes stop_codon:yes gene_type:complete